MSIIELFLIALGLSMDAFAVSVCKGLSVEKAETKHLLIAGLYFGGFQAIMPLIGFLLGSSFESLITKYDHWVVFVLLSLIGANMIKESFGKQEQMDSSFGFKSMIILAIATSIDALAVGISFAFLQVNIWLAIGMIGVVTFILSAVGVKIGNVFGVKYKSKAEFVGGVILIIMGIKILLEHLGVFG